MTGTLVKSMQRRADIAAKLAALAECGLIANEPFNFTAFELFTGEDYLEEQEYPLLIVFLGGDDILEDDPEHPACRCDALYSFETSCIDSAGVYEDLVTAIAQLAGGDLELSSVTARLTVDVQADEDEPGSAIVVPFSDPSLEQVAETASGEALARTINLGLTTATVTIQANGKCVDMEFQQEGSSVDWSVLKCLAALARLRSDERRFFFTRFEESLTVGYLPLTQIRALGELGISRSWANSRLPLPVYTATDLVAE